MKIILVTAGFKKDATKKLFGTRDAARETGLRVLQARDAATGAFKVAGKKFVTEPPKRKRA